MVESASDAIIFADRSGVIRVWSDGAQAIFGYRAEEAIGRTLDILVPEGSREAHWNGFHCALKRGRSANPGYQVQRSLGVTKDGSSISLEISADIIWGDKGQATGIMPIGRPLSESQADP